jgi:hypothetical protein
MPLPLFGRDAYRFRSSTAVLPDSMFLAPEGGRQGKTFPLLGERPSWHKAGERMQIPPVGFGGKLTALAQLMLA